MPLDYFDIANSLIQRLFPDQKWTTYAAATTFAIILLVAFQKPLIHQIRNIREKAEKMLPLILIWAGLALATTGAIFLTISTENNPIGRFVKKLEKPKYDPVSAAAIKGFAFNEIGDLFKSFCTTETDILESATNNRDPKTLSSSSILSKYAGMTIRVSHQMLVSSIGEPQKEYDMMAAQQNIVEFLQRYRDARLALNDYVRAFPINSRIETDLEALKGAENSVRKRLNEIRAYKGSIDYESINDAYFDALSN